MFFSFPTIGEHPPPPPQPRWFVFSSLASWSSSGIALELISPKPRDTVYNVLLMNCRLPVWCPSFRVCSRALLEVLWNVLLVLVGRDRDPFYARGPIAGASTSGACCLHPGDVGEASASDMGSV